MSKITVTPQLRAAIQALQGNGQQITDILIEQETGSGLLASVERSFLEGLVAAVFRAADTCLEQELAASAAAPGAKAP